MFGLGLLLALLGAVFPGLLLLSIALVAVLSVVEVRHIARLLAPGRVLTASGRAVPLSRRRRTALVAMRRERGKMVLAGAAITIAGIVLAVFDNLLVHVVVATVGLAYVAYDVWMFMHHAKRKVLLDVPRLTEQQRPAIDLYNKLGNLWPGGFLNAPGEHAPPYARILIAWLAFVTAPTMIVGPGYVREKVREVGEIINASQTGRIPRKDGPTADGNGEHDTTLPAPTATIPPAEAVPLPEDRCLDGARKVMASLAGIGDATVAGQLFDAWSNMGSDVLGCDIITVEEHSGIWIAELVGGDEGEAALIGTSEWGSVVHREYLDFVRTRLDDLSEVGTRARWGIGTFQMLETRTGSCVAGERYGSGEVVALPVGVTAALWRLAAATDTFPGVKSATVEGNLVTYSVWLLRPAANDAGYSVFQMLDVRYDTRTATAAIDGAPYPGLTAVCPSAAELRRVADTARRLEASVQASYGN